MADSARVDIKDGGVRDALRRLQLGLPLGGTMQPAMERVGRALKTGVQMRFRTTSGPDGRQWEKSFRAQTEGGQTLSLTRRLRNSITYEADRQSVAVGTNVIYAAIHQFGGTIRAKNGPFLAIPVTPEARAAGSPRNMDGLHVATTLAGQYMLVDHAGRTQYLLRQQVTIPARPFLGVGDDDRTEIQGVVERYLQERWR